MGNNITAEEALQRLEKLIDSGNPVMQHDIEDIISEISVVDNANGKTTTTILYTVKDKIPYTIYKHMYNNSLEMRCITHIEASEFLLSEKYNIIIRDLIINANPGLERIEYDKLVDDYLNGVQKFENFKPTGVMSNGTTGPWADVSYRFVKETTGDVIVYIGDIDDAATRIWWNTEMPALLRESSATSINSIKMNDLKYIYNSLDESETVLGDICRLIDHVGPDGANLSDLDKLNLYFDGTGKLELLYCRELVLRARLSIVKLITYAG